MHNEHVLLKGKRLRLVPYLEHHVPRYHQWLTDPELLEATCSEPLSLEEEYDNQKSWLASTDKLTFIILAPLKAVLGDVGLLAAEAELADQPATPVMMQAVATTSSCNSTGAALDDDDRDRRYDTTTPPPAMLARSGSTTDATEPASFPTAPSNNSIRQRLESAYVMIGDCNIFVPPYVEEDGVEVEVMIADRAFRRNGFACEAIQLLMSYAMEELHYKHFVAKILTKNESSIRMFTQKLGFVKFKDIPVFQEVHFERRFGSEGPEVTDWLGACGYEKRVYEEDIAVLTVLPSVPVELTQHQ